MARCPRNFYETSFFHVIVQGLNKEYIFEKKNYMSKYLQLLTKYKEEFKIEIISYCIMNNHAHILLYTENINEMSNFMHRVNTEYAKYYNYILGERTGYVFRDRYKSEPIKNERYLINCINYIHLNPVKANIVKNKEDYQYSSYREYLDKSKIKLLSKILNVDFDIKLFINNKDECIFYDVDNSMEEIIDFKIKEFLKMSNMNKDEILKDRILLKILIKYLKNICKIKYTDIMKSLKITKGQMNRLKKGDF